MSGLRFDSVLFLCVANSARSRTVGRHLRDPGGNLVEIYARLTDAELGEMPEDQEPVFPVETHPAHPSAWRADALRSAPSASGTSSVEPGSRG